MEEMINDAKIALASTFAMYLKAHNYHWNVEGADFPQLHEFFGNLYEDLYGAVDPIAEHIRAMDSYCPGSFTRFAELSVVADELKIPAAVEMVRRLAEDNSNVRETFRKAAASAEAGGDIGAANFFQERFDAHSKHGWMLNAILKRNGAAAPTTPKK